MEYQLRVYTIREGEMDEWLREWRERIYPLRRQTGFDVVGAWHDGSQKFVWLLRYDGADGFAAANQRYYESPERAALSPNPARHIEEQTETMLRAAI